MRVVDPSEALTFSQTSNGLSSWREEHGFVYDVAFPNSIESVEIIDVVKEVLIDDAYRLQDITQPGDVWVDVGCHVGLFSIAAIQAGAQVGVVVDMNSASLWAADANVRLFANQSRARGLYPANAVDPYAYLEEIRHVDQLIELAKAASNDFFPDRKRTCLKLDVQGAERVIFADTNLYRLALHYQSMVFEYHASDLDEMALRLESSGWYIEKMRKHHDSLLHIETYLVWAVSG